MSRSPIPDSSPEESSNPGTPAPRDDWCHLDLTLLPGRVVRVLSAIIALLTFANLLRLFSIHVLHHGRLLGLIDLVNVDGESNLPALYSGAALFFAALLLLVIAAHAARTHQRGSRHWLGLALVFTFLGIDEIASLHELTGEPLRLKLGTTGPLLFAWVIVGLAFVAVLAVIYLPFFLRLEARFRRLAFLSAAIFVSGAIGCEMLGAMLLERYGDGSLIYHLMTAAEELLEMSGVALWIYALLKYLEAQAKAPLVGIRFTRR